MTVPPIILEATKRQNNAADVSQSVWVSASAGTGKTYVLTKRILGLLLADHLLKPSEILAVTFTRAAAKEMESRLRERLAEWATMPEEALAVELKDYIGVTPNEFDIRRAKTLFTDMLDDNINSNTIHGFCQQILAKFPLEAGVSPAFKLIEDREKEELLTQAKNDIFSQALEGELSPLWVFDYYAGELGETVLHEALGKFVNNAQRFGRYFSRHGGVEGVLQHLAETLEVDVQLTSENWNAFEQEICVLPAHLKNTLEKITEGLMHGSPTAQTSGEKAKAYLNGQAEWADLVDIFLTGDGKVRSASRFPTKGAVSYTGEVIHTYIEDITTYILDNLEKMKKGRAYLLSAAYLHLGNKILQRYETIKKQQGVLDFDDLIAKTAALLTAEERSAWVRYKMDSHVKHVLLDEAQDTDSDQWGILKALVDEFYAGEGLFGKQQRTFFAVGDIKQSIYRFRGAEPHVFGGMRNYLQNHQQTANHSVAVEELIVSFRSGEPVLKFVDMIFEKEHRHKAVDELAENIDHKAVKMGSNGHIEIWPLLQKDKNKEKDLEPWALPALHNKDESLKQQLAQKVAEHIRNLLSSNIVLESTGQYINAGDILILLRGRNMMPSLIAALDKLSIPHAGADKVDLHGQAVVEDLLALLKALTQVDDNLSLAHTLKSPLLGWDDKTLDDLISQKQKLWQALQQHTTAYQLLKGLQEKVALGPYAILAEAIQSLKVRGKYYQLATKDDGKGVVASVDDTLDTLLEMALNFQKQGGTVLGFIHYFENSPQSLKRELDAVGNRVRLMTAHGSKGLEAPIVIMPDTTGNFYKNMSRDNALWQTSKQGEDLLFIHSQSGSDKPKIQEQIEEQEKELIFRDEMRLLYVALTRAKERLYIAGVEGDKYNAENCWYGHIQQAIAGKNEFQEMESGALVYQQHQAVSVKTQEQALETVEISLPAWATHSVENERGIVLLNASDSLKRKEQLAFLEESSIDRKKLFKRGQIVHRLLEVLPTFTPEEREGKGLNYLKQSAIEFNLDDQQNILQSALNVINTYPDFFGENSKAEVALSALDGHKQLEGVVDRLVVCENEVIAIDYKTNKDVPATTPQEYKEQLLHYKKALGLIFKGKLIKTCLIWTSAKTPRIDWL